MANPTVTPRFLILSDTHDLNLLEYTSDSTSQKTLPAVEVVLYCGDITENGGLEQHQKAIEGLASIQSELKLVIAGNHDIDLDSCCNGTEVSQSVKALWLSAVERGIHYLEEGTYTFRLSSGAGFTVHASLCIPQ